MKTKSKYIISICIIIIFILIDQFSKIYVISNSLKGLEIIPNILNIEYVENTGGAFGIGKDNIVTVIVTNIIVLGIILRFIILQINNMNKSTLVTLSVIFAGGLSNFLDRLIRGYVVDFIRIFPQINLPTINIADICITIRMDSPCLYFGKTNISGIKTR